MKRLLIIGLVVFSTSFVYSQSNLIIGQVRDSILDEPLVDVEVYWEGFEDKSVYTDENGIYKIGKRTGVEELNFEFSGMRSERRNINDDAKFNELNVNMVEITTSITASRWEQSIYEIPASTVVISREEIEQNGYITIQEILENVPGLFTIDHRYASGVTIGIRGFWTDFSRNVMIQVNGVNMLSERRNDFPLDKINVAVESIDKIEIVRGPMSVIYGAGAFFGVINIITNNTRQKAGSSITSGLGTQNTLKETFRYSTHQNGLNISLNAMLFHRDGFEEEWRDMIDSNYAKYDSTKYGSTASFPNAITASDYYYLTGDSATINPERYSKKMESFNFSVDFQGFFADINFANSNSGFSFKTPGPGSRNDYKTRTGNYQFGYRGKLKIGNGLEWQIKAAYMHSRVNQISNLFVDTVYVLGEDRVSSLRSELNVRYTIIKEKKDRDLQLDLLAGFYYNRNIENGSFYNAPEQKLRNWYVGLDPNSGVNTFAGYSQLELKVSGFQFIGGFRITKEGDYKMLDEENVGYYGKISSANLGWVGNNDVVEFKRYVGEKTSNGPQFIPRLAAIYNLKMDEKRNHYFKAMYGEAVNEINVVQNAFDIMRTNATLTVEAKKTLNLDTNCVQCIAYLSPEKIQTFEIGHTYVDDHFGLEINTNLFLNIMNGLITRNPYVQSDGTYSSVSKNDKNALVTRGAELILKKTFNIRSKEHKIKFTLNIGGTIQSTTSLDGSKKDYFSSMKLRIKDTIHHPTSFSPPYLANISLVGYFGDYKIGNFSFSLGGNYVGPMWSQKVPADSVGATDQFAIERYVSGESEGYWRWSANLRLSDIQFNKLKKGGLFVNLKVAHITNKKYYYPAQSIIDWANKGVLGRGRQIIGTVGFKF